MLAVNVHSGVRAFREGPYVSHWVQPTGQSILAGCGCSVDFTRALLFNLMHKLHVAHLLLAVAALSTSRVLFFST
jgi:uncharacterized ion transporter superfamily protein YfcC